jgi:hypothetical protein
LRDVQLFDLAQSPFALLAVSIRATAAELNEAKATRLFDEAAREADIEHAYSELTVESKRAVHEIAWLADVAPNRAKQLAERASLCDPTEAAALAGEGGQLTQINLSAHLSARFPNDTSLWNTLIEGHSGIDWDGARQALDESRLLSQFGPVRDASWKRARSELIARHAATIANAVTTLPDGPTALAEIVGHQAPEMHARVGELIDRIIGQYDRWSTPRLEPIAERISCLLTELEDASEPDQPLKELDIALADWDGFNQPVQLWEQVKGLDEPRSRALSNKVRGVAIFLANDHGRYEESLHIVRSLLRTFAELPSVVAECKKDLATLERLVGGRKGRQILERLRHAAEAAEASLSRTAGQVIRGSFTSPSEDEVGQLRAAFDAAKQCVGELQDPNLPWLMVRSVALELQNAASETEAASIIVDVLLEDAPAVPRRRLDEDRKTLRSIASHDRFSTAMQAGELSLASSILADMLAQGEGDRDDLLQAKANIDDTISRRKFRWIGWAVTAGIVGLGFIAQSSQGPRAPSTPTPTAYDYPTGDDLGSDSMTGGEPVPTAPSREEDLNETPPPAYTSDQLTITQLRYCRFENARMERLQEIVSGRTATDRFNVRVDDYNRRCGRIRYGVTEKAVVDGQLAAQRSRLRAEADRIAAGWPSPSVATPPKPKPLDDLELDQPEEEAEEANVYGE